MAKLDSLFPENVKARKPAASKPEGGKAETAPVKLFAADPERKGRTFIQDLIAGQEVEGIYLVQDASLRAAKNGSKYIQAGFGDRSGAITVRHWDATEKDFASYKVGGFVRARGRVETYQSRLQMIAFDVRPADPKEVDAADFLPVSKRNLIEMETEFNALVASIQDPDYKRLLDSIFSDPKIREGYLRGPAAMNVHHGWVGGLLEHVLSAAQTAQAVAEQRPFLNRDLLVTGVILHDIGKVEELDPGPGFNYTDTGRLCGHISLGSMLVERHVIALKDFPRKKRDLIQHLILSHHGTRELGSPVEPCTAEAVALHHIECMDAKVQGIQTIIDRDREAPGAWTEFARVVDGRIYKG